MAIPREIATCDRRAASTATAARGDARKRWFRPRREISRMGNWRRDKFEDWGNGDSIFANNPFLDDLLEWRDSPEAEQYSEFADVLYDLMQGLDLDASERQFLWPDAKRRDLDQSIAHIQQQYPDFRRDWIEEYLIGWIDMVFAPEHYTPAQLDQLDRLTARWIADHERRAKAPKKKRKTRHS